MSKTPGVGTERGTERIEAFSDGVFAIAITLLILEIKIPHVSPQPGPFQLVTALLGLWPSYLAYVLSFVMIGIYWANHHYVFKLFDKTDHWFNLLNLLFLMFIAFLPLPTEVLGTYMLDEANRTTAVTFYALALLLPAVGWLIMWLYARRGFRLVNRQLADRFSGLADAAIRSIGGRLHRGSCNFTGQLLVGFGNLHRPDAAVPSSSETAGLSTATIAGERRP